MMAAMRVIPQSRPRHGADVPPEAVLVKNVIAEMHNSMSVLTDLVRYLRGTFNGLSELVIFDKMRPGWEDYLLCFEDSLQGNFGFN